MEHISLQQAIQQLKDWLGQKEYDKVIIGCKEVLAKDPTNQEALSLMRKADEAKSAALKESIKNETGSETNYQFNEPPAPPTPTPAGPDQPPSPQKSPETPEPAQPVNETPPAPEVQPDQNSPETKISPPTLEETINHQEGDNNPLITPSEHPKEETPEVEKMATKEEKEKEKTRKTIFLDLGIKLLVALILGGAAFLTWQKYLKDEIYPPEEIREETKEETKEPEETAEPEKSEEETEEPEKSEEEAEENTPSSEENMFKATVDTEETIETEPAEEPDTPTETPAQPAKKKGYKRPLD